MIAEKWWNPPCNASVTRIYLFVLEIQTFLIWNGLIRKFHYTDTFSLFATRQIKLIIRSRAKLTKLSQFALTPSDKRYLITPFSVVLMLTLIFSTWYKDVYYISMD